MRDQPIWRPIPGPADGLDDRPCAGAARARGHGRSTEVQIRAILDAVVKPAEEIGIGSALLKLGRRFRGVELDIERDSAPARPMRFE